MRPISWCPQCLHFRATTVPPILFLFPRSDFILREACVFITIYSLAMHVSVGTCKLRHEISREPIWVSFNLLIESTCFHSINLCQVTFVPILFPGFFSSTHTSGKAPG